MTLSLFTPTVIALLLMRKPDQRQKLLSILKVCAFCGLTITFWVTTSWLSNKSDWLSGWGGVIVLLVAVSLFIILPAVLWWRRTKGLWKKKLPKLSLRIIVYAIPFLSGSFLAFLIGNPGLGGEAMSFIGYMVNASVLILAVVFFFMIAKPFKDKQRSIYAGMGVIISAGLVLTFILPSPVHTLDKIVFGRHEPVGCAPSADYLSGYDNYFGWYGRSDDLMSCAELGERH